jgi:hypothetical protein
MPPVVFLAVIGAAGIAGYKFVSAMMRQAQTTAAKGAQRVRRTARDLGALEWDESAGVYRPQGKREG